MCCDNQQSPPNAAGAIGFSTNRFSGHRDTSGVMVPGTLGDADEMIMIGKAVAEAGGGVYEMAADFSCYDDIPAEKRTKERVQEHYDREWGWLKFLAQEYLLRQIFLLTLSPFRSTDLFVGAGMLLRVLRLCGRQDHHPLRRAAAAGRLAERDDQRRRADQGRSASQGMPRRQRAGDCLPAGCRDAGRAWPRGV